MPRKKTKTRSRRHLTPKQSKRYRNRRLNIDLDSAYRSFCGMGLNQVKIQLRRDGSPLALAYLESIDIETVNRRAKRKMGQDSAAQLYRRKNHLINSFVFHCRIHQFEVYRESTRIGSQPDILYVYLPGTEQISWHCHIADHSVVPVHPGTWDGRKYATLEKLEKAVTQYFKQV